MQSILDAVDPIPTVKRTYLLDSTPAKPKRPRN